MTSLTARIKAAGGRVNDAPSGGRAPGEPSRIGYLYILPAVIIYGLFVFAPFLHSIYLSLFDWDGVSPMEFVGLKNYGAIWTNPIFRSAFVHSLELVFFYTVLPLAIGLVLVSAIQRTRVRGTAFFRTALFIPYVIAPTVIAVIWRWILAPKGPLNSALDAVGLEAISRPWLGDFTFALPSVGMVGTWVMFGLVLALLLAGVQKIPQERYEAARVDGAGRWMEFRAVTLPGLRYEITVVLVLTVTSALRNFDIIYVMTSGGPGYATVVPSYLVYQQAFKVGAVGAAAAMGAVLDILTIVVNLLVARGGRGAS